MKLERIKQLFFNNKVSKLTAIQGIIDTYEERRESDVPRFNSLSDALATKIILEDAVHPKMKAAPNSIFWYDILIFIERYEDLDKLDAQMSRDEKFIISSLLQPSLENDFRYLDEMAEAVAYLEDNGKNILNTKNPFEYVPGVAALTQEALESKKKMISITRNSKLFLKIYNKAKNGLKFSDILALVMGFDKEEGGIFEDYSIVNASIEETQYEYLKPTTELYSSAIDEMDIPVMGKNGETAKKVKSNVPVDEYPSVEVKYDENEEIPLPTHNTNQNSTPRKAPVSEEVYEQAHEDAEVSVGVSAGILEHRQAVEKAKKAKREAMLKRTASRNHAIVSTADDVIPITNDMDADTATKVTMKNAMKATKHVIVGTSAGASGTDGFFNIPGVTGTHSSTTK